MTLASDTREKKKKKNGSELLKRKPPQGGEVELLFSFPPPPCMPISCCSFFFFSRATCVTRNVWQGSTEMSCKMSTMTLNNKIKTRLAALSGSRIPYCFCAEVGVESKLIKSNYPVFFFFLFSSQVDIHRLRAVPHRKCRIVEPERC